MTLFPPETQRYCEFRHCPRCGAAFGTGDFRRAACLYLCCRCGFDFYQNPLPAAVAVVVHPDRADALLLLKRRTAPRIGAWCVPGGFITYGEDPVDAAAREVREETGIDAQIGHILQAVLVDYTYRGRQVCVLEIGYLARVRGELPPASRVTEEASEMRFVPVDDVLNNPEMLAFPEQLSLMRTFRQTLPA